VFIAVLFTIAKLWRNNQDTPLLMNELRKCGSYILWNLFSHKEEWNFVVCRLNDGTGEHYLK
jgi:hypothetical protein